MGIFNKIKRFLGPEEKSVDEKNIESEKKKVESPMATFENNLTRVEPYIEVEDQSEKTLVTLIASAIASGDNPNSEYRVKSVKKLNPEFEEVSLIATAIAAGALSDSSFVVKNISRIEEE